MAFISSERRCRSPTLVSHCNTGMVNLHRVKMTEYRAVGPYNPLESEPFTVDRAAPLSVLHSGTPGTG